MNSPADNSYMKKIDLAFFLRWARRHWRFIIWSTVICSAAGIAYLYYTPKSWTRTSQITMKFSAHGIPTTSDLLIFSDIGILNQSISFDNEKHLVNSYVVWDEIVDDLKLNYEYSEINALWRKTPLYRDNPVEVILPDDIENSEIDYLSFRIKKKGNGLALYDFSINEKSVEKLVKAYANVSYTANKFIGEGNTQYDQAGKQLENYAQQMILIQQQIDTERDKKDPNNGQIQEWEQKIQELGAEMEELVNSLVEDIMGGSYSEIAEELSDAFFEAFQNGEDYAEAWGDKVKDIVADVMRRMVVQRWIEPLIGDVFDKYKDKWFPNGQFAGMQSVMDSLGGLEADLTQVGEQWIDIWNSLPESVKEMMNTATEETREASSKSGINASQESVDELNGRATAIQGHTYSISENTKLLVANSNRILESVLNIEVNTDGLSARMETVESHVKEVRDTINDIALKGIKIK